MHQSLPATASQSGGASKSGSGTRYGTRSGTGAATGPALAALGIVYGDLGTSPLYTYQTIVSDVGGHPSAAEAVGLLSLVVWALIITVSIKYCVFVMRADNNGEGGILALMSLVTGGGKEEVGKSGGRRRRGVVMLIAMGLFGAALIYGDGVITPAISVLSALEGVNVATSALKPYILPASVIILIGLFVVQPLGTAKIGKVFGPVMALWFLTIGIIGLAAVIRRPEVLAAISPGAAVGFLLHRGLRSFFVLGGVFLAITGGEALYADMGHLGRFPIRLSWYCIVLPSLLLSYAGQTAFLVGNPRATGNPFFLLAPHWSLVPLVVLATVATVIASQAIITGAFSLTRQAMQLGWFPGLTIRQTSDKEYGQIYVPFVNWLMMLGTVALALGFRSSDRLAGAYGTAVSTTMLLTTALLFNAMRDIWRWPLAVAGGLAALFMAIDLVFFGANMLKLLDGGWVPLLLGILIFAVMRTWHAGIRAMRAGLMPDKPSEAAFWARLHDGSVPRVPGTAVFLSRSGVAIPQLMMQHVAQMKALAETVVSLTIRFEEVPRVPAEERSAAEDVGLGIWHVTVRFGFVEVPNLTEALACAKDHGCPADLRDAVYFAARDTVAKGDGPGLLPAWQRLVFGFMYRNAVHAADRFALPVDRFLEVGRQLRL